MSARPDGGLRLCDWCGSALSADRRRSQPNAITCSPEHSRLRQRREKKLQRRGLGWAGVKADRAERHRERLELIDALEAAYSMPAASHRPEPT